MPASPNIYHVSLYEVHTSTKWSNPKHSKHRLVMLQYAQYPSTRRENAVISFNLGSLSVGLCNYAVWGLNGLKHQKKSPLLLANSREQVPQTCPNSRQGSWKMAARHKYMYIYIIIYKLNKVKPGLSKHLWVISWKSRIRDFTLLTGNAASFWWHLYGLLARLNVAGKAKNTNDLNNWQSCQNEKRSAMPMPSPSVQCPCKGWWRRHWSNSFPNRLSGHCKTACHKTFFGRCGIIGEGSI